jgi:hypothetical protein
MVRRRLLVIVLVPLLSPILNSAADQQLLSARTGCEPPAASALSVTLRPQETEKWCWAASAQMVMEYLGKQVEQCKQANDRLNRNDCCKNPTPRDCIKGNWPDFKKYGFTFQQTTNAPLSWTTLKVQLAPNSCAGTPFAFTWQYPNNGGGHMMVATGYFTDVDGKRYVFVNNPWETNIGDTQTIQYEVYVALPGDHTHWDDFYDIK